MTSYEVTGATEAAEEAKILVERSQFFSVTPLPDDVFLFQVKVGEARTR